eukprot:4476005-Amphidinium_carterae.1
MERYVLHSGNLLGSGGGGVEDEFLTQGDAIGMPEKKMRRPGILRPSPQIVSRLVITKLAELQ